jgi:hypothetical protein
MASDDWRIRVELPAEEHAHGLLGRLHAGPGTQAERLTQELQGRRLAVSCDGPTVFVYAESRADAEQALAIVESELAEDGIEPVAKRVEQWLADEDRWDDDPPQESWEQEQIDRGFAPWEVRVEVASRDEADALGDKLEAEGYSVVRRFTFVIAGTDSEEAAKELAARVGGEVEAGGEVVWESPPNNPFAVFGRFFGGLGG